MKLVKREGAAETDLEVELVGAELTVGDLALALALGAPGHDVVVDGRRLPASTPLDAVRLGHGSVVEAAEDASSEGRPAVPVVELHQVAGLAAGGSLPLVPGRWIVGTAEPVRAELAEGPVPSCRFGITVDTEGRCTITPEPGVIVRVDGLLVTGPTAVSDQVVDVDGAAFRFTPPLERSRRRLQTSPSGVASFLRVPRTAAVAGLSVPVELPARPLEAGTGRRARKRFAEALGRVIPDVVAELDRARRLALRRQRQHAPDVAELRARSELLTANLWERRPAHPDFGVLSVGFGPGTWSPVPQPEGFAEIEALTRTATSLGDVPVTVPLEQVVAIGITGPRSAALAVGRWLVAQAAVLHGPADLGLHLLTSEERLGRWDWAKWLPHLAGPSGELRVATTPEESNLLLAPLAGLGARRSDPPPGGESAIGPARTLLVIDDLDHLDTRSSIARALLAGRGRPTRALIVADHPDQLPAGCGAVLNVDDQGHAVLTELGHHREVSGVLATGLAVTAARRIARNLAVLEDAAAAGVAEEVHLVDLLGFGPSGAMADDLERRWRACASAGRTSFPIGRGSDGDVLEVDLRTDGPHAFVAGMPGASTTELLRALLLAAAATFDPGRLNLVLVDTEGSGAFGRCAELPHVALHLVGPRTELGARAMGTLFAEVARREDQRAPLGPGEAPRPVPGRLLVVIDAFDTLVAESPDLVAAVVELARRGAAVGVHLVLVTRHNDAVLAGSIRAVTSLRLAPVQRDTHPSSLQLLGEPGPGAPVDDRWFVRLGSGDLTSFRRVAVSGTRAMEGVRAPLDVRPLLLRSSRRPTTRLSITSAGPSVVPESVTDVDLVVGAIGELARRSGRRALPLPGPDGLPNRLELATVIGLEPERRWAVPLGLVEAAGRARPSVYRWDTTHGGLLILGTDTGDRAAGVAAAAAGLAGRYPPAALELHVLERPDGPLAALSGLPQRVTMTDPGDVAGTAELLDGLERTLDRRSPGERHRAVLVVIGDLGAVVRSASTATVERLTRLVRAGWGVEILAVVGAPGPAEVPAELLTAIEQRLVLGLEDPADYHRLGLDAPGGALAPSRAVDVATGLQVQLAAFPGGDLAAGVAHVAALHRPADHRPADHRPT